MRKGESYFDVLTLAINEFAEHGYDSAERAAYWTRRLKDAAEVSMASTAQMEQMLRDALASVYRRMIDKGQIAQYHQGIARFTIDKVRPQLRAELDRRIMAAASLIKLNREQAMQTTLRRFQGWATSIPKGGSEAVDKREEKGNIRKALVSLPFAERRVAIDQGHKLVASLSEILAKDGGALAMIWRSHWRQPGYAFRPDHKERDGHVYTMRGNWALDKGLMKTGADGYYDEITSVGEEPFCRCYATWLYSLGKLPKDMLTRKGDEELARVRVLLAA